MVDVLVAFQTVEVVDDDDLLFFDWKDSGGVDVTIDQMRSVSANLRFTTTRDDAVLIYTN